MEQARRHRWLIWPAQRSEAADLLALPGAVDPGVAEATVRLSAAVQGVGAFLAMEDVSSAPAFEGVVVIATANDVDSTEAESQSR